MALIKQINKIILETENRTILKFPLDINIILEIILRKMWF